MKMDPKNLSSPRPERAHGPTTPRPESVPSFSPSLADVWTPLAMPRHLLPPLAEINAGDRFLPVISPSSIPVNARPFPPRAMPISCTASPLHSPFISLQIVPLGRRNSSPEPRSTWHYFSSIPTTQGDPCARAWSSSTPRDLANVTHMLSLPNVPQSDENVPNPKPPSASVNSGEQFTEHQTPRTSPFSPSCLPQTLEPPGKPRVSSFIIRR
jgi:hypothetical protein